MRDIICTEFDSHKNAVERAYGSLIDEIQIATEVCIGALSNKNKILFCGNGGSAADAQHLAAELSGRFKIERGGLPGISLTSDTSVLTSIGNDYGFDRIFERQVEAIANEGDVLIGLSTSGNSRNVLNAFRKAKDLGCSSIGLSGMGGGGFNSGCDLNLVVPSNSVARVQEVHILIGHIICKLIDDTFKGRP